MSDIITNNISKIIENYIYYPGLDIKYSESNVGNVYDVNDVYNTINTQGEVTKLDTSSIIQLEKAYDTWSKGIFINKKLLATNTNNIYIPQFIHIIGTMKPSSQIKWQQLLPNYAINIWSDTDINNYIETHAKKWHAIYNNNVDIKKIIAAISILDGMGGITIIGDAEPLATIDDMTGNKSTMFIKSDATIDFRVIMSVPGSLYREIYNNEITNDIDVGRRAFMGINNFFIKTRAIFESNKKNPTTNNDLFDIIHQTLIHNHTLDNINNHLLMRKLVTFYPNYFIDPKYEYATCLNNYAFCRFSDYNIIDINNFILDDDYKPPYKKDITRDYISSSTNAMSNLNSDPLEKYINLGRLKLS